MEVSDSDSYDYFDELPIEKHPRSQTEVKSRAYYLAQVEMYLDECYGWVFEMTKRNGIILDILKNFYGLDCLAVDKILHPRKELNNELQERKCQRDQELETLEDTQENNAD